MQVSTVVKASFSNRRRLPFRLLTVLDLLGLVGVTVVVALAGPGPSSGSLYVTMFVVGLGVWLIAAQARTLETILESSRNHPLLAPSVTILIVWAMRTLTGDDFSRTGALAFTLLWTVWMGVWRLVRNRYLPTIRILTVGSAELLSEVQGLPNVWIRVAQEPPDKFEDLDVVALDPAMNHSESWQKWLLHADIAGVKLLAAPLIVETLTKQLPLDALSGEWARYLISGRRAYGDWKRVIDVIATLLLAPILVPLLGIVLVAVLLEDGRPVIFWQERVGRNRKTFRMAKVRSMRKDAEANGPAFTDTDDPRITRVGRIIRKYRLDELPQLWNVLLGHMSLIGPRPEQVTFAHEFERQFPLYSLRYNVRPGITGWAQVRQGYAADAVGSYGKLRYDLYYVRHVSLALDGQIALRTMTVLVSKFGAR